MNSLINYDRKRIIEEEKTEDTNISTIGMRLKNCRKEDGYTLKEVAAYLRKSPNTLYKYEHDLLNIPYKDLVLLTMLYFRSMDYFCQPFYNEYMAKIDSTAALLLKYAKYSNKFYNADIYFPPEEEQEAIVMIAGYTLFPLPKKL